MYRNIFSDATDKVNENAQEMPQSQTADQTMAPRGRGTEPNGHVTTKAKQSPLSLPRQDDC